MVFPGDGEDYMAATGYDRSKKTLHNFTLPNLWGKQRYLRCVKVDSDFVSGAGDQRLRRRSSVSKFGGGIPICFAGGDDKRRNNQIPRLETVPSRSAEEEIEEGIEEFTEKMISDIRTKTDAMRKSITEQALSDEDEEEEEQQQQHTTEKEIQKEEEEPRKKEKVREREREVSPPEAPGAAEEVRPWNLRKRRAACKEPIPVADNCDGNHQYHSLNHNSKGLGIKRLSFTFLGKGPANSTKEETKFISTLTKKQIEEDFMMMVDHRPPRRPHKRPRTVQKKIDLLHPAFYFTEITHDIYKVSEAAENGKRR